MGKGWHPRTGYPISRPRYAIARGWRGELLNIAARWIMVAAMTRRPTHTGLIAAAFIALATGAEAACYADYKAKQDGPLRLHYGVVELPQAICDRPGQIQSNVADRLRQNGWELLNVMSVFDASGLDQRKDSAAEFFLRF